MARTRAVTMRAPWRGPAPDPMLDRVGAARLQRATARWAGALFVAAVALQRLAVPGLPTVSILIPLTIGWVVWGALRGLVEVDRQRWLLWLAAAATTALLVPLQVRLVQHPSVSPTAWGLLLMVWLPAVVRVKDRRRATYRAALRLVSGAAAGSAALCVLMTATQLAGLGYHDVVAAALPTALQLQGFVITYPVAYGLPLMRANGWIGLEPSIVSFYLGIGLVAGVLSGARLRRLLLLAAGLVCATAGSGLAVLIGALLVMLGYPVRRNLLRYLPAAVLAGSAMVTTPFGQAILARATEAGDSQSSTSLRGITPYTYLWPQWVADPWAVLLGAGPGSAQNAVDDAHVMGLLVPTPAKLFFEYGLVGGVLLAVLILFAYVGGPSRSLAVTLAFSLWVLQPGTTALVVILPVFVVSTWWAPRIDPVLESDRATFAVARRWVDGIWRWRPFERASRWRPGGAMMRR
jgi:hypothetical protein